MIDVNHLFTLHRTYTGLGCAICGKGPESHPPDLWLVNGEKKEPPKEKNVERKATAPGEE
jgi:hypothetical protein